MTMLVLLLGEEILTHEQVCGEDGGEEAMSTQWIAALP